MYWGSFCHRYPETRSGDEKRVAVRWCVLENALCVCGVDFARRVFFSFGRAICGHERFGWEGVVLCVGYACGFFEGQGGLDFG